MCKINSVKNPHKYDIGSIADLCIDIIIQSDVKPKFGQVEQLIEDYCIDAGGSVAIFASQYAKLGGKICLAGLLGDDAQGNIVLSRLKESQVDVSLVKSRKDIVTAMGFNYSCKGDRALLVSLSSLESISPIIFEQALLVNTLHWHIGGFFLLKKIAGHWIPFLKELKVRGTTVSLDTNWDPDEQWGDVLTILPFIDVFIPNDAEAMAITRKESIHDAGILLLKYCPLIVIKCGEKGAVVFSRQSVEEFNIPEELLKNLNIKDTTGAGDNFDAGFLFMWLRNKSISESVINGFRCAISSLGGLGGIKNQYHPQIPNYE